MNRSVFFKSLFCRKNNNYYNAYFMQKLTINFDKLTYKVLKGSLVYTHNLKKI